MPNLDDCKNPVDGSTDWDKYRELQAKEREERTAKGELCRLCGHFIVFARGYPQICRDCENLDGEKELDHPSEVRCPACGSHWRVGDGDDYDLYQEGTHGVTCGDCDHEFEVETRVTYSFTSPERVKEEEEEGDGEEEKEEKEEEDGEAAQ